jgi:predicted esterase
MEQLNTKNEIKYLDNSAVINPISLNFKNNIQSSDEGINLLSLLKKVSRNTINLSSNKLYKKLKYLANYVHPQFLFNTILDQQLYERKIYNANFFEIISRNLIQKKFKGLMQVKVLAKDGFEQNIFMSEINPQAKTKIYFHGKRTDIRDFMRKGKHDYEQGYNVIFTTYRGFSSQAGVPNEENLLCDARAVLNYALNTLQIPLNKIELEGHSLGCAIVLKLIAKHQLTSNDEKFTKVTLFAPFSSMQDMTEHTVKVIPASIANYFTNIWNNEEALQEAHTKIEKLTIIHSKDDPMIPFKQSKKLVKTARKLKLKTKFVELDGFKHDPRQFYY